MDKPTTDNILTTDEMDGIFTEEDRLNKYNAYSQCLECLKWTFIIGSAENYGSITNGAVCQHCGSSKFDVRSTKSKRTFNPLVDNKRKPNKK